MTTSSYDPASVTSNRIPPVPTPNWGSQSGGAFTVRATTTINGSTTHHVLDSLLNTTTWPKWNNFVPSASLTSHESGKPTADGILSAGVRFTEHVDMRGRGKPIITMKLLMTTLESLEDGKKGSRAVWLGKGYPDWALRSERVHDIYEGEREGEVVYDVYETFSGPLANFVKWFVGKALVARFGQWNGELKGYVEGLGEEERG